MPQIPDVPQNRGGTRGPLAKIPDPPEPTKKKPRVASKVPMALPTISFKDSFVTAKEVAREFGI